MATFHVSSLRELERLVRKHAVQRQKRIERAVERTARASAQYVRTDTVPVAFSELRDSIHVEVLGPGHVRVIADAPHAAAVEVGSRPHWVPIEPLVRWVKLRGFQGLVSPAQRARLPGSTTEQHALDIKADLAIRSMRRGDGSNSVDDPLKIARSIAAAIAKSGTRPQWYMRRALPFVHETLAAQISAALPDR
jgi:hypothetical protein